MIPQPVPPFDPSVLVASLSWAVVSVMMLMHSVRMRDRTAGGLWALSLAAVCMVAVVFWSYV